MNETITDNGLAKVGNAYFMVRSPNGATHCINPKNKRTYCGKDMLKMWNVWRPTDELPDEDHKPTCSVCLRHYYDPINEELQKIKRELLEQIDEYLWLRIILKDVDGLGRFTELIAKFLREEVKLGKQIAKAKTKEQGPKQEDSE
jgi:hypothetical protein